MLIAERVAGSKPAILAILLVMLAQPSLGHAEGRFRLENDGNGSVRPFKAVSIPLADFVREYARFSRTVITVPGTTAELRGTVTLFLKRPLSTEELTEVFHRVLSDNSYAAVDAPAGNGWVIQRLRDARDGPLPVYSLSEVPNSARYVTVIHSLKHSDSEAVARMMRSFMPANSRIIPAPGSQIFITDTASNVRRLAAIISRLDTEEVARWHREEGAARREKPSVACGEQRIEKLVVEKLEIHGSEGGGSISRIQGGRK